MITIYKITDIVSEVCQVNTMEIYSRIRTDRVCLARHLVCYFTKRYTDLCISEIGRKVGRSHATALWSIRRISDLKQIDKEVINLIEQIRYKIAEV